MEKTLLATFHIMTYDETEYPQPIFHPLYPQCFSSHFRWWNPQWNHRYPASLWLDHVIPRLFHDISICISMYIITVYHHVIPYPHIIQWIISLYLHVIPLSLYYPIIAPLFCILLHQSPIVSRNHSQDLWRFSLPSGQHTDITPENHHFEWVNHHSEWENHHFQWVNQRFPLGNGFQIARRRRRWVRTAASECRWTSAPQRAGRRDR